MINGPSRSRRQLVEQVLGFLQIERVEPFGEPAVDRSKKLARLIPLALIAPEAGEVESCTQLPEFCTLPPRNRKRLVEAALRCGVITAALTI